MSEHIKHSGRTPPPNTFNASTNKRESKFNKFCTQTTGADGKLRVTYSSADGNSAGQDYDTTTEPTGCIRTNDYDSDTRRAMSVDSKGGSERKQQKNQCDTTDDNSDRNTLGCSKETVGEEKGEEAGKNRSSAVGGNRTDITKGVHNDVTPPGSKNNRNQITSGNINRKHTGSESISVEGDYFHSTGESRYDVVKNGEYAIHVQNGTLDVLSKKTVRITGDERVILTCGSSYILMLPNRIEIVADKVDINPSAKTIDVENLSGST
jgi:hypothetical protein